MGPVTLEPITAATRARCAAVAVFDDQRRFVAPVADYLALCDGEDAWTPLAVCCGGAIVGFAMWGFDAGEGSHWIGGVVIDRAHQGRGVGRAAMRRLIGRLSATPGCCQIALSVHPENRAARRLYRSLGFAETGERTDDGEIVARMAITRSNATGPPHRRA